jgi:hypothetical protein
MVASVSVPPRGNSMHRPAARCQTFQGADALDGTIIAALTAQQVARMTRPELVRVILASRLPMLLPGLGLRLRYRDRPTLRRLVFLARECCRHRSHGAGP